MPAAMAMMFLSAPPSSTPTDVSIGVDAKSGVREFLLNCTQELLILRRDGDGGGISTSDFLREGWSAEGRDSDVKILMLKLGAHYLADHFGHSQKRFFFEALRCTHDQGPRRNERAHAFEEAAAMLRGHDTHDDLRVFECGGEFVGGGDRFGDGTTRQKSFIHMPLRDRFANVDFVRP